VISAHPFAGLELGGDGSVVEGNYVGTNAAGTGALPNGEGIEIHGGQNNVIGGGTAAARNVISGNANTGVRIEFPSTTSNFLRGNYIGLDATGAKPLPNSRGVEIRDGAFDNVIGGSSAGYGNVISANAGDGIAMRDSGTHLNLVLGNLVGTDASGTKARGNSGAGVSFSAEASGINRVGGNTANESNTIAFNHGDGVLVDGASGPTNGDIVLRNSIFSNTGLGIRLANGGNDGQAAPTIDSVTTGNTTTTIALSLSGAAPSESFRIDVYASPKCDPSGAGEGKQYLGTKNITTDGSGNGSASLGTPARPAGEAITATAKDNGTDDSSAFSLCRATP